MTLVRRVPPFLDVPARTAPTAPSSGKARLYVRADGILAWKGSDGVEREVSQVTDVMLNGGSPIALRPLLDLIEGTGIDISVVDNSGGGFTEITIAATGGGGSGDATSIQGETVDAATPDQDDVLTYDAGEWKPLPPSGGGGGGGDVGYESRGYTRSATPDSTMFPTWRNQGSCTLTDVAGVGHRIVMPGQATNSWHMRSKSCPSVPFTRTFELVGHFGPGQYHQFGAGVFNSANNDFYFGGVQISNGAINPLGQQWSDFGSFAGGAGDLGAVVVYDTHFFVQIEGHASDPTQWRWRIGQAPEHWSAWMTWNMSNIWAGSDITQLHLFFGLNSNSGTGTGLAHTVTCLSYS